MWTFTAILSLAALIYLALRHRRSQRWSQQVVDRRRLYLQSVARIEAIVVRLNAIEHVCEQKSLREEAFLDRFESCLQRVQALLETMLRCDPTARDGRLLTDLKPLIEASEQQLERLEQALRDVVGQDSVLKRWSVLQKPPVKGCYFCSRPFRKSLFSKLRIRLKEERHEVWVCQECRAELKSKGEVPTLYFRQDGKTIHWSEHPTYDPFRDFASLRQHKPQVKRQNARLTLVAPGTDSSDSGS